jgi:putative ABC transport system ATP-binding protein
MSLSHEEGAEVLALLHGCHAQGQTVVIVTHDSRVAFTTDRVVFFRYGVVVDDARLGQHGERDRAISKMIEVADQDDPLLT